MADFTTKRFAEAFDPMVTYVNLLTASEPGGNVLTEGTGRIMEVYVVFPVGGKLHIGRGGIYSQYEFVQPTSNRLTDEQWRQRLDQGQIPPIGDWKTYIAK